MYEHHCLLCLYPELHLCFSFLWLGCVLRKNVLVECMGVQCLSLEHLTIAFACFPPAVSRVAIAFPACNLSLLTLQMVFFQVPLKVFFTFFFHIFDVSQLYCGIKAPVSNPDSNHTRPHLLSSCVFVVLSHASLEFFFSSTNYNH